jgi:predicted ATPase
MGAGFFGRGGELADLAKALDEGARVLTVTGPGGIGKTRLVRELVERSACAAIADLPTAFVDLEQAANVSGFERQLVVGLGHSNTPELNERDHVLDALRAASPCVVVLDNFEQLVASSAARVSALHGQLPGVTWIITSRERLRIPREAVLELGSLELPARGEVPERSAAVALFLDRARSIRGTLEAPSPAEMAAVVDIVNRLEGVPLALEVAAARMDRFSAPELASRLASALAIEEEPAPPPSLQTDLSAVMRWSWDLLDPDEQAALAQAAVFRGGFRLEQAEEVIRDRVGTRPVAELLARLRDKSLLHVEMAPGEAERFRLLAPMHAFADHRLRESGQWDATARRHIHVYLDLVRRHRPSPSLWFSAPAAELAGEDDNIATAASRAADLAEAGSSPDVVVEAAVAAHAILLRSDVRRGRAALDRALLVAEQSGRDAPPSLLFALAQSSALVGDVDFEAHCLKARDAARAAADPDLEGNVLRLLAVRRHHEGKLDEARALHREVLASSTRTGNLYLRDLSLQSLGLLDMDEGRTDAAVDLLSKVCARAGSPGLSHVLLALASLEYGDPAQACRQLLSIASTSGSEIARAAATGYLGLAYRAAGQIGEARAPILEGAVRAERAGVAIMTGYFYACAGGVEAECGDPDEGMRLLERGRATLAHSAYLGRAAELEEGHVHLVRAFRAPSGDREQLRARVAALLDQASSDMRNIDYRISLRALAAAHAAKPTAATLRVAADGSWFELAGVRVRCDVAAARRILAELARARRERPGLAVGVDELISAGWPGEKIDYYPAKNRLFVALAGLRKLGLRGALSTTSDGYLLCAAEIDVVSS